MNTLQKQILSILRDGQQHTARDLASTLGVHPFDVQRAMPELYRTCWVHYRLEGGRIDGPILYSAGPKIIREMTA